MQINHYEYFVPDSVALSFVSMNPSSKGDLQ